MRWWVTAVAVHSPSVWGTTTTQTQTGPGWKTPSRCCRPTQAALNHPSPLGFEAFPTRGLAGVFCPERGRWDYFLHLLLSGCCAVCHLVQLSEPHRILVLNMSIPAWLSSGVKMSWLCINTLMLFVLHLYWQYLLLDQFHFIFKCSYFYMFQSLMHSVWNFREKSIENLMMRDYVLMLTYS